MSDFVANYTEDGSVGLFSNEVDDIYHSKFGALSEAYEKFILPSNIKDFLNKNNEIKILDICFGIGYNSKSFLNFFVKNFTDYNKYISSIDTDNILKKKSYSEKLHDEKKYKILIHGIDNDETLIKISPFINQIKNNRISNKKYYIKDEVNIILLEKLFAQYKNKMFSKNVTDILTDKTNKKFFSKKMIDLSQIYQKWGYKQSSRGHLSTLLHNIYYRYVSLSYKKAMKLLKKHDFDISCFVEDARTFIQRSNICYDYIFLDAFSPAKAPCLWSVEFFAQLYNHLSDNGMILTYSNSAAIRNAFLQNNFYVGKIFDSKNKKFMGTIASKNKSLIKIHLDEFDLGLLNTKSGICFHDENLSLTNSEIINNRNIEVENSNLVSTSHYKKEHLCNTMR